MSSFWPIFNKWGIKIIMVTAVYYGTAVISYSITFEGASFIPYWPPSGVAFALAIIYGKNIWPGILIATILINLGNRYDPHQGLIASLFTSSVIALGNIIELLVGVYLIKHWAKVDYPFFTTRNTFRFMFIALIMCLIGALVGYVGLYIRNDSNVVEYLKTCFSWWMESTVGVLIFTPFILSIRYKPKIIISKKIIIELLIFVALLFTIYLLLLPTVLHSAIERGLPFLIVPFLLWLAFRFGLTAVSFSIIIVSFVAIYFTTHQIGPFVLATSAESSLVLQLFCGVISFTVIVLSASVHERTSAEAEVITINQNLENLVGARTKTLNEEIEIRLTAEQKLQHINQELIKRNSELDNFVYSVSHDLRAPIASLMGLINLLKKDSEANNLKLYLEKMTKSVQQQDHFIQEILDQSRNSRLEIRREEIVFESLLNEAFDQLRYAAIPGQLIEKQIDVNQDNPFYSDRWRLKIILNNLIANSIRYSNTSTTIIKISIIIKDSMAYITVIDNGIGIGKEHLLKVYDMFYRATDQGAGSGLGLYIVKETLDKLNGKISIISQLNEGTTVNLEIPATKE